MRQQLDGLQILRGFAAVAVVVYHLFYHLDMQFHGARVTEDFSIGGRGVQLFFVLSGFIIYYVHPGTARGWSEAWLYCRKRIVRILPLTFLVATAWGVVVIAMLKLGLTAPRMDLETWLSSAFVMPALARPSPIVIWTLRHELFFYALFLLSFFSPRLFFAVLAAWCLAALAVTLPTRSSVADAVGVDVLVYLLTADVNVLFGIGLLVAILVRRRADVPRAPHATTGFWAALALLFVVGWLLSQVSWGQWETVIFGLFSALSVYSAARSNVTSRLLVFLGDASFSIYLVHVPLIFIFVPPAMALLGGSYLLALAVMTVVITALCCLVYIWVERPLLVALKPGRRDKPKVATASS